MVDLGGTIMRNQYLKAIDVKEFPFKQRRAAQSHLALNAYPTLRCSLFQGQVNNPKGSSTRNPEVLSSQLGLSPPARV